MQSRGALAIVSLLLAASALACSRGPGLHLYPAHGIVRGIQVETGQILIEHDEIEGLMPAMTMSFDVPDRALLARLAVGQTIEFTVEQTDKSYRLVEATVTAEAGSAGASGGSAGSGGFDDLVAVLDPAPDFELVDQNGTTLTLASLRGKLVVLDFIYTACPGPCPMLTSAHVTLQRMLPPALRERTRFVSISIDPVRDTPMALRAYGLARGADLTGWSFLTGPPETVASVMQRYGVGSIRQPDGQIDHLIATFLIDGQGRIAQRFIGLEHEPKTLLRALEGLAG
jgi:protein SCO1/2